MRRSLLAPVLAVVALFAAPRVEASPDALLYVKAVSGQSYEGTITGAGQYHAFLLEDFAPQLVTISVKASKGSALVPDLLLFDPSDTDISATLVPFRKDGAKSVAVKNATSVALPGRYTLVVTGKAGTTGGYLLKATAKVVRAFKGSGFVENAGGSAEFSFFAPTEALVTLAVTPGTGSTIAAVYDSVAGAPCADPRIVPGLKAGTGTFSVPVSADHTVTIEGDGGTAGAFNWKAKVKAAKASKKPVRVNGGAPVFPDVGPAPAVRTVSVGQSVVGFAADAGGLGWREVRTQGGGPNGGKNSVGLATLTGGNLPGTMKDFAVDLTPPMHAFALGPTHAVAYGDGELFAGLRSGGNEFSLGTPSIPERVLADGTGAFLLDAANGIDLFPYAGGGPLARSAAAGTYIDMAFGAAGIVFALQNGGGNLVIYQVARNGTGEQLLADFGPNPGLYALAARGPDVFVALDDGDGGTDIHRVSACFPGTALPLAYVPSPVRAMCADELNLYLLEDDAEDGVRLRQVSRGGGEAVVLARPGNGVAYADDDLAAAGGYVYLLTQDLKDLYRVKRR